VSLRFRNELRMELRMRSCQVELLGRGWNRPPLAVANGTGSGVAALNAALQALQLTEVDSLPSVARLTVADEYVHHALVEADGGADQALEAARVHYAQALQRDDLRVQVIPLERKGRWLAAAVIYTDLQAWRQTLEQVGLQLTHLHTALVEDLRELAPQIPEDDAVIALLREEGISLVRLKEGLPVALAWERLDTSLPQALGRPPAGLRARSRQPGRCRPPVRHLPLAGEPGTVPLRLGRPGPARPAAAATGGQRQSPHDHTAPLVGHGADPDG
jgi:hypothetical protein